MNLYSPQPLIILDRVNFGVNPSGENKKNSFFQTKLGDKSPCLQEDEYAVAFLSNFSINNNFSHFLHGLLRLFCALIDAQFIVWDSASSSFVHRVKFTIWLDEYFRITPEKEAWLKSFTQNGRAALRALASDVKKGHCVSSKHLLYGSGCVRLLPPGAFFSTVIASEHY